AEIGRPCAGGAPARGGGAVGPRAGRQVGTSKKDGSGRASRRLLVRRARKHRSARSRAPTAAGALPPWLWRWRPDGCVGMTDAKQAGACDADLLLNGNSARVLSNSTAPRM